MEISACSRDKRKEWAGSTSHIVLHFHLPNGRRKRPPPPPSKVQPLTSLRSGEVWGTAAWALALVKSPHFLSPCLWFPFSLPGCSLRYQDSGEISTRVGCAKWLRAGTPPGTPPESRARSTSWPQSLVSSRPGSLYGTSVSQSSPKSLTPSMI